MASRSRLAAVAAIAALAFACTADSSTDGDERDDSGASDSSGTTDSGDGDGATTFVERDGFVVMEVETIGIPDGHEWEARSDLPGHTGAGYYAFVGNRICNGPAGSPLRYDFTIEAESRYELRLRMTKILHCAFGDAADNGHCASKGSCDRAGAPDEAGECLDEGTCLRDDLSNDVFVHLEDADGNYVPWKEQPADTIGDPIKLFVGGGQSDTWRWSGATSLDVSHQKWDAHWDLAPGRYALVLSGRSQLTRVDRMVLFDQARHSFSGNDAVELTETR